jgi:hypothetical protein
LKSTAVIFEEEFVTMSFVNRDWDKNTKRRFFRWTPRISGLDREQQRIIDQEAD